MVWNQDTIPKRNAAMSSTRSAFYSITTTSLQCALCAEASATQSNDTSSKTNRIDLVKWSIIDHGDVLIFEHEGVPKAVFEIDDESSSKRARTT